MTDLDQGKTDLIEVIADLRTTVDGVLAETRRWEATFQAGLSEIKKWEDSFKILGIQLSFLQEQIVKHTRQINDAKQDIDRVEETLTGVVMNMTPLPKKV